MSEIAHAASRWRLWPAMIVAVMVLVMATLLGTRASPLLLAVLVLIGGVIVLLLHPTLGLVGLVFAALASPLEFGTGTEVALNLATLLVPALLVLWVLDMLRRREVRVAPSRANLPLFLFLLASLLSLLIGTATWDPAVPRSSSFTLVQLAQWAIFAFSAGAFWLTGNLVRDEARLRRVTFSFLSVGGLLGAVFVMADRYYLVTHRLVSLALISAPFWMLLIALAGGQLIFNQELSTRWRLFLLASGAASMVYAFYLERATASNWVGMATAVGVLAWLHWPRLRWLVIILLVVLGVSGVLSSSVYEFAGGSAEWEESGGSRLALIGRVVEVTMRNPVTGLGPAAYRPYAGMKPLSYLGAYWVAPQINSHNNYVDLFSQVGLLGLALFFWFAVELTRLGLRLRTHFAQGFAAGYVNGMLSAGAGALVLMAFADWILPFVYNIGFPGFQASVLLWLFLGGLLALEQKAAGESAG